MLLNLCVNARDAMPDGGTITITANNLLMDQRYAALEYEAHEGPYILLDVEDTGTGIAADVIDQIWDPFFTTKEVGKGTGLGLSTSLAIIRSHGGYMRVESDPGRWTRVRVFLPADAIPTALPEPTAVRGLPRGRGELILVIDDESVIRNITRKILENFGYRVVVASDGVEALAIHAELLGAIRLVLTDMMMPVMDGPATINALLARNPALPIIATSGLDVSSTTAHAAHGEVKAVLSKPFTAESLLRTVRDVLDAAR
ncbi:MAG: response regulator [Gemmatimonadales bacterium]